MVIDLAGAQEAAAAAATAEGEGVEELQREVKEDSRDGETAKSKN